MRFASRIIALRSLRLRDEIFVQIYPNLAIPSVKYFEMLLDLPITKKDDLD